jgi:hypothetical protein
VPYITDTATEEERRLKSKTRFVGLLCFFIVYLLSCCHVACGCHFLYIAFVHQVHGYLRFYKQLNNLSENTLGSRPTEVYYLLDLVIVDTFEEVYFPINNKIFVNHPVQQVDVVSWNIYPLSMRVHPCFSGGERRR